MPNQRQYASRIINTLGVTDPDLDTGVGTVSRKLIDAFSEVMAEASIDTYMLSYAYDVDTKSGEALDDLARLFGITRLPARRASGEVTFARTTTAEELIVAIGSQLSTASGPDTVTVGTTVTGTFAVGQNEITVPAQALVAGAAGNVAANTITRNVTNLSGITSFDNSLAFTGGADSESDAHLRSRIKRTALRNLAGTEAMFLGVALDDPDAKQANVIGAAKRHREQIQLLSGTATSVIENAAFIYEGSAVFGAAIDSGDIKREGVHYSFDASANPPTVTSLGGSLPDGVYELEYDYLPLASRNNPLYGVTNRIDLYIWGQREVVASETLVWRSTLDFVADTDDEMYVGNFQREDESSPTEGNYLIPFSFAPVMNPAVGGVISIGGTDYTEGTDFYLIHDWTPEGLSPRSRSGIEWVSAANGGPAEPTENEPFDLDYTYNEVPTTVASQLQLVRAVTTDLMVHQAKPVRLNFHLAVILTPGYTKSQVEYEAGLVLTDLLAQVGFDGILQTSDVLAGLHGLQGIDAIRFLTSNDDATNYGIQRVNEEGTVVETFDDGGSPARASDVVMDADSIPVFNDVTFSVRATNTLGSV